MLRALGLILTLLVAVLTGESAGQSPPAPRWPEVQGRGVCLTDPGWCPLPYPEQTPVGAPCYCVMPGNRYVYGVTTAGAPPEGSVCRAPEALGRNGRKRRRCAAESIGGVYVQILRSRAGGRMIRGCTRALPQDDTVPLWTL